MCAFVGNGVGGLVFGILVLLAMGVLLLLRHNADQKARERRDEVRSREKLRRQFWGCE
jgi:hypothetical protein